MPCVGCWMGWLGVGELHISKPYIFGWGIHWPCSTIVVVSTYERCVQNSEELDCRSAALNLLQRVHLHGNIAMGDFVFVLKVQRAKVIRHWPIPEQVDTVVQSVDLALSNGILNLSELHVIATGPHRNPLAAKRWKELFPISPRCQSRHRSSSYMRPLGMVCQFVHPMSCIVWQRRLKACSAKRASTR